MKTVSEIIKAVRELAAGPRARCTILSDDGLMESSLMGTRGGYLNLIVALLELVAACESASDDSIEIERLEEDRAFWSDNIKAALNQLPGNHAYIVGSYLFDDHRSFLAALEERVNSTLPDGVKLGNDPDFAEP